ncbi:MAG: arginine deiminase family protein, partial [Gammaproteobacteria bacterium]
RVQVHHEWGTLKEVVVGIPFFRIPEQLPDHLKNFAATKSEQFLDDHRGKTIKEADPRLHEAMTRQMDDLIKVLTDRGIKIHRPDELHEAELRYLDNLEPQGAIQLFPRDSMLVIGNHLIETETFSPLRRREKFGIRRSLFKRVPGIDAQFVTMPSAFRAGGNAADAKPSPLLEGGDVFVLGKEIYVGVSGNASNSAGVEWLQGYLGDDYKVHEVRLEKKFLHLDCCLSTPREGLAIICREAFVDGLPKFLDGWQLIELPFEVAKNQLGCNGLVLDRETIIIHTDLPPAFSKSLRDAGQEVIEMPFDAVYFFSGAFRCWHHPLVRESSL